MVLEFLKVGKKNAIPTSELLSLTGIGNAKELRLAVARERRAGAVILSSCAGGYYLPATKDEIEEFVRTQDKKARSIMVSIKSARNCLRTLEGQLAIEEQAVNCG